MIKYTCNASHYMYVLIINIFFMTVMSSESTLPYGIGWVREQVEYHGLPTDQLPNKAFHLLMSAGEADAVYADVRY